MTRNLKSITVVQGTFQQPKVPELWRVNTLYFAGVETKEILDVCPRATEQGVLLEFVFISKVWIYSKNKKNYSASLCKIS